MIAILGIESSCDETSASVLLNGTIQSNIIATQEIHKKFGGVVPELASRAHETEIVPVVNAALQQANIDKKDLNAIAYTNGPGLLGSLLVGSCFAKSMAQGLKIPTIAINHMEAHIMANFIDTPRPTFPFLCLTVSGGHTQLVLVTQYDTFEVLGNCLDDAVGEAFDKISKIIGLPYPGGPEMDRISKSGNIHAFKFPIAETKGLDFSFSGIKTFVANFIHKELMLNSEFITRNIADLCASVQFTLVETLLQKLRKAQQQTGIKQIALAGGVAANSYLRIRITEEAEKRSWQVYIPKLAYCTDNAAMIAMSAYYKYQSKHFASMYETPNPRLSI